ncbi:MAG TPA: CPBP family intramembrane glutamic endopeptidase [Terracidiphilus sp.]|jgi:membrane protease YdiL (CAAX protease family)|nr:CPBP family intramembrane glutamic endopeptidase [Terracidiphilus sp.]
MMEVPEHLPPDGSGQPSPTETTPESAPSLIPVPEQFPSFDTYPSQIPFHATGAAQQTQELQSPDVFTRILPPRERIPHIGHVVILTLLALCSLFASALVARLGVHYHLFGVKDLTQAASEIHFTLGTEGIFYLLTLFASLLIFPLVWHKGLLTGLQWRGSVAVQHIGYLIAAAAVCFGLALLSGLIMPGPPDAPIDKIFRAPGAAWILFAFGVTFAPFFEELAFRGFLLPALCTAFDWIAEKFHHQPAPALDFYDHPQWSMPAMAVAAVITSILFALLHADQTGYSIGPFLLLICVSLVLCAARLILRSVAASIVVHACYNFLLFSVMFLGTSGFKHLENM